MKVRNEGPDRLVPLPDGDTEHVEHLGLLDTTSEHARSLAEQDDWTLESVLKANRTRKAKAKAELAEVVDPEPEPVASDEPELENPE